jgi:hypothetical protein
MLFVAEDFVRRPSIEIRQRCATLADFEDLIGKTATLADFEDLIGKTALRPLPPHPWWTPLLVAAHAAYLN